MLVLPMSHVARIRGMILRLLGAEDTAVQRLHDVRPIWRREAEMNATPLHKFLDCVATVHRATIQNQVNVVSVRALREASDGMEPR
jgi:hypothetical protein